MKKDLSYLHEWGDLLLTDYIIESEMLTEKQFHELNPTREKMISLIEVCLKENSNL